MSSNEDFKGYRTPTLDLLQGQSAPVWSLVTLHTTGGNFSGLILPRSETADADHIITPSHEGPTESIRLAFEAAHAEPKDVGSWDLHATATPGDFLEIETVAPVLAVINTAPLETSGVVSPSANSPGASTRSAPSVLSRKAVR